jgi:hypothetical protein
MALKDTVNQKFIIEGPALNEIKEGDTVASRSSGCTSMEEARVLCKDLLAGTQRLRAEGETYLPRWEGEDTEEYNNRRDGAVLVPFYQTATRGLVDKVFSRPLQLTDVPPALEDWWENVDNMESTGDLFLRRQGHHSLALGLGAFLVDHQRRGVPAQSRAEEERQGLRPYCKMIHPSAILEAKTTIENGRMVLERFRYYDPVEVDSGEWLSAVEDRVVVLYRGEAGQNAWMEVWVRVGDNEWTINEELGGQFIPPASAPASVKARFREIPVVPVYTGDHGFWYGEPVLKALAEMNLQHYQKKSNFDTAVAISSVPMNAFIGWNEEELSTAQWGPHRFVSTANTDAKVQDISFSMNSADIALADLDKLERHIALAAMDPQSTKATGEEKSTIRLLDEAKTISRLQAWALQWLNAGQEMLAWAGAWMGIEDDRVGMLGYYEEVFDSLKAQPDWQGLLQLAALVDLPPDVLVTEAQRFGVLSDEWDADEIADRIITAGPGLDVED